MNEKVKLYGDGVYRWTYDLNLKENKIVLEILLKVLGISLLVPVVLLLYLAIKENNMTYFIDEVLPIFLMVGGIVLVVSFACYYGVAAYYGWHFQFYYEMDEEGVTFSRYGEDLEKTEKLGRLGAFTGIATKNHGLTGTGAYMAANAPARSVFKRVYAVKAYPKRDLIKVNSPFLYNQIYVNKDDYDFVLDFIRMRAGK